MTGARFAGGECGAAPARFRAPAPAPGGPRQAPPRVAIAHSYMGRGGSEARALWAAQALVDGCRVALLAPRWVELAACDAFYGTALAERGLGVCNGSVPAVLFRRAGFLRLALFERHCRRLAPRFDVHVSAYNWMDFGLPAVHCIADFSWDWELQRLAGSRPGRPRWLQSAYLAACRVLAGLPPARSPAETGLLVANSEYTAELLRRRFGLEELPVLYPPVGAPLVEPLPWHAREPGLVCLGRISPEKRLERAIEIVRRLRARGHRVRLHLVGKMVDTPYGRAIRRLCERERDWVVVHGELVGAAKWELLGRQRFGIHACEIETFGIAVGELAKAGCVSFVPARGGVVEIVGEQPLLAYRDIDDAVGKIERVLGDEPLQRALSQQLRQRGARFSAERFMREFAAIVWGFAASRAGAPGGPRPAVQAG
ncbi:MAG: hypothetical protein KatS3mg102_2664 [Planctomycetota bacterium]|nr:MAG: hypothetical protein KatS3mg102_2664 [Planctomycetota bacterium]